MGRGRKGIIEQSERKPKVTGAFGKTFAYLYVTNRETKKYQYLNMSLILWRTWIHKSLSIFFCQTTTTDTLKHRVGMLLEANLILYMQIQVCLHTTMQKYLMHNVMSQTAVSYFFASFITSTTSWAIFLTSFCQAWRESSAIACHIVRIKTIILYVCY